MEGESEDARKTAITVVIVFFILSSLYQGLKDAGVFNASQESARDANQSQAFDNNRGFSLNNFFPKGNIKAGYEIITKGDVLVYNKPAGEILGEQDKRTKGIVVGGPAPAFGLDWYAIDFPEAPDGWVLGSKITSHVGGFLFFNIIPILFGALLPFIYFVIVIALIGVLYMHFLNKSRENLKRKKIEQMRAQKMGGKATMDTEEKTEETELPGAEGEAPHVEEHKENPKWTHIKGQIQTMNANDWRHAIIEADIMLYEMLEAIGYDGETIADKLKNVEESDFMTLNKAWEAHKVRNRIAHRGSDYKLTRDEAERIIGLYEEVFKEFYYI